MEPTEDIIEPTPDDESDDLSEYRVAGLESAHPSLMMFLYSSPIFGCLFLFSVPFLMIALAGTRNSDALFAGVIVIYLLLLGSIIAPFIVYRRRRRTP